MSELNSQKPLTIKEKIQQHKPVGFTRAEKVANKDTVQKKASIHEDKAIAALAGLLSDRRAPATAKARAADILLDRMAGKAVKHEDSQRPEGEFDKMSEGQLLAFICSSIHGMSAQARGAIAEAILAAERNISIDAEQLARDLDAEAAERVKMEAAQAPKPKRVPRR
jgi:hypothetical protein